MTLTLMPPPSGHALSFGPPEAAAESFIYDLLGSSLISAEDWERLTLEQRSRLLAQPSSDHALSALVDLGLLTHYQSARISTGNRFGLVLGNFRILERIGAGGMAVVYKAEHIEMRHLVAIKVLHFCRGDDPRLESRFSAEMRAVARLRHPNIVAAMDAGRAYSPDPDGPVLWYLVMEYVPGEDLERYVRSRGPLEVAQACNIVHQIASALAETDKLRLVHRDIKPSNILITPEEQAKLLDFGLSRHVPTRMTQPGTILGTIDFMAPEQARDASSADIRADIYSLGGTLYWCLTGQTPFSTAGSELEQLVHRLTAQPPCPRAVLPDLPEPLCRVVQKMMALSPDDRYATPQEVMQALLPFLRPPSSMGVGRPRAFAPSSREAAKSGEGPRRHRVLVVDDEPGIRMFCRELLQMEGIECHEAASGDEAAEVAASCSPDLVLLDVQLPGKSGYEVLRALRAQPPSANLKVLMLSGMASPDELASMLLEGADDFLSKPFSVPQFFGRVKAALRLKDAQDRSDSLNQQLLGVNQRLEQSIGSQADGLAQAREALVLGVARLVLLRENDGGARLERLRKYCRVLAEEAAQMPSFSAQATQAMIDLLTACAPLHDIGKVGLPDHILLKPGKLAPDERVLMQAHTTVGAQVLSELIEQYPAARAFLQTASDIIRHHHERYDGTGYPDRLAGQAIPLTARIVAIADVYDALRSRRSYKPALSHAAAVQLMHDSPGQFDPALMQAFSRVADRFDQIFRETPG
jgi:response regulator RpfG family c-di-GMP phosphodiesterase